MEYIRACRKLGVSDNPHLPQKENRDSFVQEIYRECLVDVKVLADGTTQHVKRYCIPALNQKLGRLHKPAVCLFTLLKVYGFTYHNWQLCVDAIKSNPSGRVASLRHKVWKDDKLPEHKFADMENVFKSMSISKTAGESILNF